MDTQPMWRRLCAEFVGTGMLVMIVVGSGIAASRLTDDIAVQLLANSLATALGLSVLIAMLGPVSGAHFNPVVTGVIAVAHRARSSMEATGYTVTQVLGAIGGALLANAMFDAPLAIATTDRVSAGTLLGEVVATAGLILVITGLTRQGLGAGVGLAVGAYIGAAYWFTSSTSFANPAVTVGRIFTDTFAGIAPSSAVPFIVAQILGAAVGAALSVVLFRPTAGAARVPTPTGSRGIRSTGVSE